MDNDLISRQAAIDFIDAGHLCNPNEPRWSDNEIVNFLKSRPSAQPERRWIPVKTRPMDEDAKQYLEEHYGYKFDDGIIFKFPMPEDGQEVWVCSIHGTVWQDVCEVDEGIGLEENGDWEDIVAWMPFERPEPYKGEENELTGDIRDDIARNL